MNSWIWLGHCSTASHCHVFTFSLCLQVIFREKITFKYFLLHKNSTNLAKHHVNGFHLFFSQKNVQKSHNPWMRATHFSKAKNFAPGRSIEMNFLLVLWYFLLLYHNSSSQDVFMRRPLNSNYPCCMWLCRFLFNCEWVREKKSIEINCVHILFTIFWHSLYSHLSSFCLFLSLSLVCVSLDSLEKCIKMKKIQQKVMQFILFSISRCAVVKNFYFFFQCEIFHWFVMAINSIERRKYACLLRLQLFKIKIFLCQHVLNNHKIFYGEGQWSKREWNFVHF